MKSINIYTSHSTGFRKQRETSEFNVRGPRNEVDDEARRRTVQQLLDLFVEPEIKRRQEAGTAECPFPLRYAQIIFFPNGKPHQVRLNEEVKTVLKVKLKEEHRKAIKKGDPIYWEQIETVEATQLTEEDDPNVGHATLLNLIGSWFLHFDFIYNKERSAKHLEVARQFLDSAESALTKEHLAVAVDSLCSASELAAKAYLLRSPDEKVMKSKTHGVVASKTNMHAKLGNLEAAHVAAFNRAWNLRNSARYLEGEIEMTSQEVRELLDSLKNFVSYVQQSTSSVL